MSFKINLITLPFQEKDNPFDNDLSFDTAKTSFKEYPEILEQFSKLKEIENNLKEHSVSIGISMGYESSAFKRAK
jgi:hypothetical protein